MNMLVLTWCPRNHFPLLLTIYMVSLSLCHQQASAFLPLLCQWHTTRTTDSPGSPQHLPPGKTKGRLYSNFLQTAIKQRFSTLAPSLLIHNQCHILWQLIPLSSWEINLWVCFDPHLFFHLKLSCCLWTRPSATQLLMSCERNSILTCFAAMSLLSLRTESCAVVGKFTD